MSKNTKSRSEFFTISFTLSPLFSRKKHLFWGLYQLILPAYLFFTALVIIYYKILLLFRNITIYCNIHIYLFASMYILPTIILQHCLETFHTSRVGTYMSFLVIFSVKMSYFVHLFHFGHISDILKIIIFKKAYFSFLIEKWYYIMSIEQHYNSFYIFITWN